MKVTLEQQLERLTQDYRRIKADRYLASRVLAQVDRQRPHRSWLWLSLGGATAAAVIIAVTLVADRWLQPEPGPDRLAISLPAMPTATIRTPVSPPSFLKMPNLSQLGRLPVLPQTPDDKRDDKLRTERRITNFLSPNRRTI